MCWGGRDRQSPMACWPTRLEFQNNERHCLQKQTKKWWHLRNHTKDVLTILYKTHIHAGTCIYVCIHIYIQPIIHWSLNKHKVITT